MFLKKGVVFRSPNRSETWGVKTAKILEGVTPRNAKETLTYFVRLESHKMRARWRWILEGEEVEGMGKVWQVEVGFNRKRGEVATFTLSEL